jgi:predicted permease
VGLFLAVWGIDFVIGGLPREEPVPYWMRFTIDRSVLFYTMLMTLLTGVVFGLAPAIQAVRSDVHEVLKDGGRGSGSGRRRNRLRSALVVAEIALSLILLIGASLFGRSFLSYQFADTGFDASNMLTLRFYLAGPDYIGTPPKARLVEDVVRRVEAIPGVVAAGASETIPLAGGGEMGAPVYLEGRSFVPGEEPLTMYTGVTGHFFSTLRVRPIAGRLLTEREAAESSSVAVVNELFARRFWPDGDAVGHRIRFAPDSSAPWITLVGVIATINNDDIDDEIPPSVYLPYPYYATRATGLIVRTTGDPARFVPAVRDAIRASDPGLPLYAVMTMAKARQLGFWEYGFFSSLFAVFAVLALILAAIGVYGVISYAVGQRTREIGVRVALGAQRGDVFRMIVGDGLVLALLGVVVGLLGSLGATRVIASMLVNVSPTDPVSFIAISLLLTAVAILASWLPARRATKVDPMVALRNE